MNVCGRLSYTVIRYLAAGLLLLAATLKSTDIHTGRISPEELSNVRLLQVWLLVVFESCLAFWIVFDFWRDVTRWLSIAWFGCLGIVSLHRAFLGYEECGCFGSFSLHPMTTVTIDFLFSISFYIFYSRQSHAYASKQRRQVVRAASYAVLCVICSILASVPVARVSGISHLADEGNQPDGRYTHLIPEMWVGKKCPLLKYVDVASQIDDGKWIAILYRDGCADCDRTFDDYSTIASSIMSEDTRIVAINVDAFSNVGASTFSGSFVLGTLNREKTWVVETPRVFALEEGVVRAILPVEFGSDDTG